MNLVYKNEDPLFVIALVISTIVWTVIVVASVGIALLFIPYALLLYVFAHSAFIAHFKGRGALISAQQFPDLDQKIDAAVQKLQMKKRPQTYIVNGNGIFNAFATKFIGKYYVVLNSSVVDALQDNPDAINFYIGHELGHIKRKHLLWQTVLAPALILPLLGSAYSRAREYTCDLHGAACCADARSAMQGLAVLAVGGKRWKTLDAASYTAQTNDTRGFWMSFHELVSSYPWLTKRFNQISPGFKGKQPERNGLAYLLAIFIPRLSMLSLIVIYCAVLFSMTPNLMKTIKEESKKAATIKTVPQDSGRTDEDR